MPIFEYKCAECGTRFEKLVRRESDEASMECPQCGTAKVDKELSTFAAHANGRPRDIAPGPCGSMCPTPGKCGLN
jgi:putative FmdB family regulatory protein